MWFEKKRTQKQRHGVVDAVFLHLRGAASSPRGHPQRGVGVEGVALPAAVPQALARAHVPAAPSAVAAAHILKKAGLLGAADRGAHRPRGGQHARLSPAPLTRRPPPRLQDIDLRQCGTVKSADDLTNKPFSFTVQVELATPARAEWLRGRSRSASAARAKLPARGDGGERS